MKINPEEILKGIRAEIPKHPFYFRLPRANVGDHGDVDPWFGLNRSMWCRLVLPHKDNDFKPEVKSLTLRKVGRHRGVRLVVFASAKAYFEKLEREQLGGVND